MEELDFVQDKYGYCYYKKGTDTLHREDGPAYHRANLMLEVMITKWCIDGELHRTDGPAIEYSDGYKCWYFNDKKHRVDGPAEEFNNHKLWWINGERLSPEKEIILNKWWENKNAIR